MRKVILVSIILIFRRNASASSSSRFSRTTTATTFQFPSTSTSYFDRNYEKTRFGSSLERKNQNGLLGVIIIGRHGVTRTSNQKLMKNVKLPIIGSPTEYTSDSTILRNGKFQMENVGIQLKKLYGHLLLPDDPYDQRIPLERVKVCSTNESCTIESAEYVLSKLYPPHVFFPPIPINPDDKADILLSDECPNYVKYYNKANTNIKQTDSEIKLRIFMNSYLQTPISKNDKNLIHYIRQILILGADERDFGEALWAKELLIYNYYLIRNYMHDELFKFVRTKEMLRLFIGQMLSAIVFDMHNIILGEYRISYYSSHDSTMAAILHALETTEFISPGFGATLRFEIIRVGNSNSDERMGRDQLIESRYKGYIVQVLYSENDNLMVFKKLEYKMSVYMKKVVNLIPDDWEKLCFEKGNIIYDLKNSIALAMILFISYFYLFFIR